MKARVVTSVRPRHVALATLRRLVLGLTCFGWLLVTTTSGEDLEPGAPPPTTLHSPRLDQGQFQFSFSTVTGWVYRVQYRDTLGLDYWHDVGFDSGANAEATVTNPATAATGFYRVATEDLAL